MSTISKLANSDIKFLTSGQVITDVVSIVKELLENSLDARASSINISIDGIDQIVVKDNGTGVARSDTCSLTQPHHTSKIVSFAELSTVRTYGFRGEALSAIAELAQSIKIISRTSQDTVATSYQRDSTNILRPVASCADPQGTTVIVVRPWHKMPVRRQKMRSDITKIAPRLKALIQTYSFVHLTVRLQLVIKSSRRGDPPTSIVIVPQKTLLDSLSQSLGRDFISECSQHTQELNGLHVTAVLPKQGAKAIASGRGHFFYVDNRPVSCARDIMKLLLSLTRTAIHEACPRIVSDAFAFVNFRCPLGSYDPNLEPSKDNIMPESQDSFTQLMNVLLNEAYTSSLSTSFVPNRGIPVVSSDVVRARSVYNNSDRQEKNTLCGSPASLQVPSVTKGALQSSLPAIDVPTEVLEACTPTLPSPCPLETPLRRKSWKYTMFDSGDTSDEDITDSSNTKSCRREFSEPLIDEDPQIEDFIQETPALTNPWTIAKLNAKTTPLREPSSDALLNSSSTLGTPTGLSPGATPGNALCESQRRLRIEDHQCELGRHERRGHKQSISRKRQKIGTGFHPGQNDLSSWIRPTTSIIRDSSGNNCPAYRKAKLYNQTSDSPSPKMTRANAVSAGPELDHPFSEKSAVTAKADTPIFSSPIRKPTSTLPLERSNPRDQVHNRTRTISIDLEALRIGDQLDSYERYRILKCPANNDLEGMTRLQSISDLSGGMSLMEARDQRNAVLALFVAKKDEMLETRVEALVESHFRDMKMTGDSDGFIRLW